MGDSNKKTETATVTTPNGTEVGLLPIEILGGQTRFALLVGGSVVCRGPSAEGVKRKTEPGSVAWVLGASSKTLTSEGSRSLDRRLESGALRAFALTGKTASARLAASVTDGSSFLSKKVLEAWREERQAVAEVRTARRAQVKAEAKEAKAKANAFKGKGKKEANVAFSELDATEKRAVTLARNVLPGLDPTVLRALLAEIEANSPTGPTAPTGK
jgi:hypothetical protein